MYKYLLEYNYLSASLYIFCNLFHLFCISIALPNINNIEISRETCLAVSGRISWTTDSTSPSVSYDVLLRLGDDTKIMDNTMNTFFQFTGLMPGRSYTATVVSVSDIGIGFTSMNTFYIPTEQDAILSGMCILIKYMQMLLSFTYIRMYIYVCVHMYVRMLLGF